MSRKRKRERAKGALEKQNARGYVLTFSAMNDKQKDLYDSIQNNTMSLAIGPPGTAKTYVACVSALKVLQSSSIIKKIYLVKSVTTLEGEDIGFLKGDLNQKMEPFVFSFRHNFEKIIGRYSVDELFKSGIVEVLPMAYLRGVNLDNCIIIADEAQNVNSFNMRTLLTRVGKNSKIVVLGDTKQVDLKFKGESSLEKIYNLLDDIDGIGRVEFTKEDIVRSKLVQQIEEIFDKHF